MNYCRRAPRLLILLLSATLAWLSSGCGGPRPAAETAPTPLPIPGYEALQEQLHGRDLTPLRHRRLVLDPGHGGYFRGALGPNGLTEAEVNLGVALNLRGLLEWAGAEVWLTRTADTDFLSPADSSLVSDLAMRVSLSDSLQPDVFLSIHHNSTASLDRTINETQTYYPLDDDGASLDLARSIHRHLVVNLGIQPASILPGNFHVLRNATVPAVLGEPAMISHPVMAERLSLAASQRLEAEAYFLGLLDYFSGGLPTWSGAPTDTVRWGGPDDPRSLSWHFLSDGAAAGEVFTSSSAPGPDPARIRLTLDGRPVAYRLSPDALAVTWDLPADLAPAGHVLQLQGRNLADRATPLRHTVLLPRAAATLQVSLRLERDSGRGGLHWWGTGGSPLPSGTLKLVTGQEFPVGPEHAAWALVDDLGEQPSAVAMTFHAAGSNSLGVPCEVTVTHLAPGHQLRLLTQNGIPFAPTSGWRGRLGAGGSTPLVPVSAAQPLWLEGPGVQALIDPQPDDPARSRTVAGRASHWETMPLLAGLKDKIIVLDPVGGGTVTDGAGPLGLRGADLNLAVAQQAAQLLRGAGAHVHLTRDDETALLTVEKVRLAGRVEADLFLTIGRAAAGSAREVRHHPGSAVGSLWAAAAVRASALLSAADGSRADSCRTTESSAYLLRHTACPALEWRLDPPLTPTQEMRQLQPDWHRAEARAVLLSIAAISGHPAVFEHLMHPEVILRQLERVGGLPAATVDWVQLDGNLPWSPLPAFAPIAGGSDSVDSQTTPGLPAMLSRHTLEIHAGNQWQVWLLERASTDEALAWQPTLLLSADDLEPR